MITWPPVTPEATIISEHMYSKNELLEAVNRLRVGGHMAARYTLTADVAQSRLRAAIEELCELRMEKLEWLCRRCSTVITARFVEESRAVCKTCGSKLELYGPAVRDQMLATIQELQDRVNVLTEVAQNSLGTLGS